VPASQIDAGEATRVARGGCDEWRGDGRTSINCRTGGPYSTQRRLAFYNDSYRRCGIWTAVRTAIPDDSSVRDSAARRAQSPTADSGPGRAKLARGLSRRSTGKDNLDGPTGRAVSVSPRRIQKAE